MGATVLYMSMSLDGFVAGPNAGPGNGLRDDREWLHEWFGGASTEHSGVRRVPILILSRDPEAQEARWPLVTYESDVEAAMAAAKEAAGE